MLASRPCQLLLLILASAHFLQAESKIDVQVNNDPQKTASSYGVDEDHRNVVVNVKHHHNYDERDEATTAKSEKVYNAKSTASSSSSASSEEKNGHKRHKFVLVQHDVNGRKKHVLLKVRGHRLVELYRERDGKHGLKKHLLLKVKTPHHHRKYIQDEYVKKDEKNDDDPKKKVSVRVHTSREDSRDNDDN
ncbi:hypothetical protein niasHS_013743 [Heterodera schachtii]|uniref:Uncharacterized protein n=1 Tax=Heterodera schachtii TaxID=97005 RepID=A0ABD2IKA1_HETSC